MEGKAMRQSGRKLRIGAIAFAIVVATSLTAHAQEPAAMQTPAEKIEAHEMPKVMPHETGDMKHAPHVVTKDGVWASPHEEGAHVTPQRIAPDILLVPTNQPTPIGGNSKK
jgi:hypothetical protein